MARDHQHGKITTSLVLVSLVLGVALVLTFVAIRYKDSATLLQDFVGNISRKLELLSAMRANLMKSEEAEKSAVMADTDEASRDFADESRRAGDALDRDLRDLESLLHKDHTEKEMELFHEVESCWAGLRKVDGEILGFAVQNTNLKAAALAFGKGQEAVRRFDKALNRLIHSKSSLSNDKCSDVVVLASDALEAGLRMQNLLAPHIVEARDERMDQIEMEMRQAEGIVDDSMLRLADAVAEDDRVSLQDAKAAYDEFRTVTAEVIKLSRLNTNIKSFELSLGRKRKIAARCDEILIGLQEAVRKREFKATR